MQIIMLISGQGLRSGLSLFPGLGQTCKDPKLYKLEIAYEAKVSSDKAGLDRDLACSVHTTVFVLKLSFAVSV